MPKRFRAACRVLILLAGLLVSPVLLAAGISASDKYAWAENAGWFNFNSANNSAPVQVYPDHLEGFVWAENLGWIRLGTYTGGGSHTYANTARDNYGVNHDGNGRLSGYGWSETVGWIKFQTSHSQVTLDPTGVFNGYAWSENVGYVHCRNASPAYQVAVAAPPCDVNGDGSLNALDVVAVINAVLGIQPLPAADVNRDGAFNALDVVSVINCVLGI